MMRRPLNRKTAATIACRKNRRSLVLVGLFFGILGFVKLWNGMEESSYVPARPDEPLIWKWQRAPSSSTPRVLVAQYAARNDPYQRLLDVSAPVNQAYARKHGYDYVQLLGLALTGPPKLMAMVTNKHSYYNKLELVMFAEREGYDYVFVLDADAVVLDFDTRVPDMVPAPYGLAAARVQPETDGPHAWNINVGVMAWNLNHKWVGPILKMWKQRGLFRFRYKGDSDDQGSLQWVLREKLTEQERSQTIHATNKEFSGLLVRHAVRAVGNWNSHQDEMERRAEILRAAAERVCAQFKPDCEH